MRPRPSGDQAILSAEEQALTVNAVIWRWTEAYDTSSKRYRLRTKMDDVHDAIIDGNTHPAQAEFDQTSFTTDLAMEIGPEGPEGDWLPEYYEKAVVVCIANVDAIRLLPRIQRVANRHSLNVAARF
jgi:hypothetical protein